MMYNWPLQYQERCYGDCYSKVPANLSPWSNLAVIFHCSPTMQISFGHPRDAIICQQFRETQSNSKRQVLEAADSIRYKTFVDFNGPRNSNVNMQVLSPAQGDRLNFIAIFTSKEHSKQHSIMISEYPIAILEGISYFVLRTHSWHESVLRIIYLLSESIYIQSRDLFTFQLPICRTIELDGYWNFHKFLYVLKTPGPLSTVTVAQSKQLGVRESKDALSDKQQAVSHKLALYFTQIYNVSQQGHKMLECECLKSSLLANFPNYQHNYLTYQTLCEASKNNLFCAQTSSLRQFYELNIRSIYEGLSKEIYDNFSHLADNFIDSELGYEEVRNCLAKVKKQALEPFLHGNKSMWLKSQQFRAEYQQLKSKLAQQENQILSAYQQRSERRASSQINSEITADPMQCLGNAKFNSLTIRFSTYKQMVADRLAGLFEVITAREVMQQGPTIRNNQDLLLNLDRRLEINNEKKCNLQAAVSLAERENQYLQQVVRAVNINRRNH